MSEHDEQVALFAWAALMAAGDRYPELALLFAVPNGARLGHQENRAGRKFSLEGMWLRAEGLKAGVPDVWLPVARGGYNGMVIEMKFGRNGLTDDQILWKARLAQQGWKTAVCYSFEQAQLELLDYLDGKSQRKVMR